MHRVAAILIAFLSLLALGAPASAESRLLVASSGEHLWIVRESPRTPGFFELLHHAINMTGPHAAVLVPLHTKPEAVVGFGDRVWVIGTVTDHDAEHRGTEHRGTEHRGTGGRSVLTLRVRERPEIEMYTTEPEGRLTLLDMLPGAGDLVSVTATPSGPAALLRVTDPETDAGSYRLLELRGDRWRVAALPPLDPMHERALLAVDGPDLARLNLLVSDAHDPSQTLLHRRTAGAWSNEPLRIDLDLQTVQSLTHVRGRLAATIVDETSSVQIAYLRPGSSLPLATLDIADHRAAAWGVTGMNDGFRAVVLRDDSLLMSAVHWITGEVGAFEEMTRPPLPAGRLWHITIMLTIAVIAVLLVLLVRPGAVVSDGDAKDFAALPERTAILSPISRFFALLIDLVPGAILALLIMRVPPVELLRLPLITHSIDQAAPHLIMLGITLAHVTLAELLKATSLGKALMGGRVITIDGSRPDSKQILIRNALKLLILIVPPLAIFALLSRHLQGFNDVLARTVVIGELPAEEPSQE